MSLNGVLDINLTIDFMFKYFYTSLLVLVLFCSCEKSLFNAGKTISKEFPVAQEINVMEVQNMFEITLIQDTINKVIVTCGENLMPDIHISVSENVLYLDHSVSCNWSRKYEKIKVDLHFKTIPRINLREPASINTKDTITTENFVVTIWGRFAEINASINANFCGIYMTLDDFGKYVIKGKCNNADILQCGSGFVDCRDLSTINCNICQKSIADTYVNVKEKLGVNIIGQGNIYYSGNPEIQYLNQPVPGKLIQLSGTQ
jgi:hypothetical protein